MDLEKKILELAVAKTAEEVGIDYHYGNCKELSF